MVKGFCEKLLIHLFCLVDSFDLFRLITFSDVDTQLLTKKLFVLILYSTFSWALACRPELLWAKVPLATPEVKLRHDLEVVVLV